MLTPEEIQTREFLVSLRGYDRDEVRAFLDEVAEEIAQLRATAGVAPAPAAPDEADEGPGSARPATGGTPAEPESAPAPDVAAVPTSAPAASAFAAIGAETTRILEAAQAAGEELLRRAQAEADTTRAEVLAEAERQVAALRDQAAAAQQQIDVLLQRRDEIAEQLRQARETVELALIEIEDPEDEQAPADATTSVLAEATDAAPVATAGDAGPAAVDEPAGGEPADDDPSGDPVDADEVVEDDTVEDQDAGSGRLALDVDDDEDDDDDEDED